MRDRRPCVPSDSASRQECDRPVAGTASPRQLTPIRELALDEEHLGFLTRLQQAELGLALPCVITHSGTGAGPLGEQVGTGERSSSSSSQSGASPRTAPGRGLAVFLCHEGTSGEGALGRRRLNQPFARKGTDRSQLNMSVSPPSIRSNLNTTSGC
jgi:hypothetical protein